MKSIQLYMLAVFAFYLQQISAAEQSQEAFEAERQAIIDSNIIKYSYLSDAFNFLQSQNLVDESFHDFLDNRLPHGKDEELEFGVVIDQAERVLTTNMRDIFIQTLENAITDHKKLNEFDRPIFLYAMQHKDDFMHDIVHDWLYEWSNIKDIKRRTPLHRADMHKHLEIVSLLMNAHADVDAQDQNGWTLLLLKIKENDLEAVSVLINAGANVNFKNINHQTPLGMAIQHNYSGIVLQLINAGADVNLKNNCRTTPLYEAVYYTNAKIVRMLLDAGAKLNIEDMNIHTPLYAAVKKDDIEIVTMLIDAGADVNTGKNVLFCVAVWNNSMDMTRLLLLNTDPDINYKYGNWTPLHHATYHNKTELISMLINAGAHVNIQDDRGDTPLHFAVINSNVDAIRMLFDAGVYLSIENNKGYTPSRYIRSLKVASIFLGIYFCPIS